MKSIEVDGLTFVKDYTPRKFSRLDWMMIALCACAVLFFIVRLAI